MPRHTRRPYFLVITFFLASLQLSVGQSVSLSDEVPSDPTVRSGQLANGLKYYIQKNLKPENRAELRLAVAAGAMQEDDDQLGVAHFVEHMAFNGSENFSKNELVDYLESVGTRFGPDLNAYTSFDETVYMLQVRTDDKEQFDKGLLVLEDWAGGVQFDDEEIDKERGVVVSEWRTRLSAEQRMQQEYFPVLLHGSRYAERLPIGEPEIIEKAPYETFRRFYRDWYRPDLMAVIVVGDIDVDDIEQEIRTRFSDLKNPDNVREKEEHGVPAHDEFLMSVSSDKEASFTNVRLMYKHKRDKVSSIGDYRSGLIHQLYNRMINARLYELNSTADPPFVFASSGYGGSIGDMATYTSNAMAPEGGALRALEVLLIENKRVLEHGFVASEFEREKQEMLRSIERRVKEKDKTESRSLVSRLVQHYLNDLVIPSPDQTLELYQKILPDIKLEEINALPAKWMRQEGRVLILTGPEKEEFPLPSEDELTAVIEKAESIEVEAYEDDVMDAPLFDKMLTGGKISKELSNEALDIHTIELANGISVMLKSTEFKNDEILMAAYSDGGHSLFDDETYLSARAATSVMNESGLGAFSAPQLDKALSGKRVFVSPFLSERYEGFNGSCSSDDVEVLMQLVYMYATDPSFQEDGLQAYVKKQETIYANLLSNPGNYFGDQVTRIRYNNHPRRGFPDVEDLQKVDLETIKMAYIDRFSDMSDFTFVFTGAFDLNEMKELCAKYLGSLPGGGRVEDWKDVGANTNKGRVDTTFFKGEAPKSDVRIIYSGAFEWNDHNRFVFRAMIDYLRIELRETLREEMGGVYGVSVYGGPSKEPEGEYSITISFNADPPRAAELTRAVHKVLEDARSSEISQEDLDKVMETQRQARIKNLKQNRYWHSGMVGHLLNDDALERLTLESLEAQLESLTAEDIQKAVRKYVDEKRAIQAALYPQEYAGKS